MSNLCFTANMTSAEWAAWFQAWIAGLAIIAAAIISNRQAKAQYEGARKLQHEDYRQAQKRITAAIALLAANASRSVAHVAVSVGTRDQIHDIGESRQFLDLGELDSLARSISSISLHDLPTVELVMHTMILSSTVRQFSDIVRAAIRQHRDMTAPQFGEFFNTLQQMIVSLNTTVGALEVERTKLDQAMFV
jgi:hypothetical protein